MIVLGREAYTRPVGVAREPAERRIHWAGRILLAVFIGFLGFLLINRVISPPDDAPRPQITESELPGPL